MKRVVGATFLLFYATFSVVAISEHTASYASTVARHSPIQSKTFRAAAPHTSHVRILEDPYLGFQIKTSFVPGEAGVIAFHSSSNRFDRDPVRFTASRAPPAFL